MADVADFVGVLLLELGDAKEAANFFELAARLYGDDDRGAASQRRANKLRKGIRRDRRSKKSKPDAS